MKKTILALTVVAFTGFGTSALAGDYDLGSACRDAVDESVAAAIAGGATDAVADYTGCTCMTENTTDEITASFEAAAGDQEKWSEDGAALVAQCFPQPEAAE
jgi:hypothetical protein